MILTCREHCRVPQVVISRKVLMMLSVTVSVDAVELGWLLGVLALIASAMVHAFATPYIDPHIDAVRCSVVALSPQRRADTVSARCAPQCEQGALVGTILTYLAGLVFTFEKETCDSTELSDEQCLSQLLEYFAVIVIMTTTIIAAWTEFSVARTVAKKTTLGEQANHQYAASRPFLSVCAYVVCCLVP